MKRTIIAVLMLAVLALASVASAQTIYPVEPLFSMKRVSLAAGVDYTFWDKELQPTLGRDKEFEAAVLGAYSLVPHLALTASTRYTLESHLFTHRVGVRVHLWGGE